MGAPERIRAYDADEPLVIASKIDLLGDGGDYYYLRKGEAHGAIEVATYGIQLLQHALDEGLHLQPWLADAAKIAAQLAAAVGGGGAAIVGVNKAWEVGVAQLNLFLSNLEGTSEALKRIKGRLSSRDQHKAAALAAPIPRDMRIICTRDERNVAALPILRALGARVRHRPAAVPTGSHRYHVNDKRFAIHVRVSPERFLGFEGVDPVFRRRLHDEFLREWELCSPDVEATNPA